LAVGGGGARMRQEATATIEIRVLGPLELVGEAGPVALAPMPRRLLQVLPELQRLMIEQPLRERLHALAMLAFYRCGRQTEALDLYAELRSRLREQLGLEPARELRELQRRILQHDDTLTAAATKEPSAWALPVPPRARARPRAVPPELRSLLLQEDVRQASRSSSSRSASPRANSSSTSRSRPSSWLGRHDSYANSP
jgi:hypothetical protein